MFTLEEVKLLSLPLGPGVYQFYNHSNQIIYIGKAANGNLAFRIWDHLKTPNDVNQFEKSPWVTNHAYDKQARAIILKGNFTVSAIVVEPKELSSLLEVYLQTIHYIKEKKMPLKNFRGIFMCFKSNFISKL